MNKLIITRYKERLLTALMDDKGTVQIDFEEPRPSILGNIYIGKVKDIVKNINAAFVDLGGDVTGYYSLDANPTPLYASRTPAPEGRCLRPGDEILVQVSKDAVKTKDPVLTASLTLTGRYCVLSAEPSGKKNYIRFSGKINDASWKKKTAEYLRPAKEEAFGLIVRTNAYNAAPDLILGEMNRLTERLRQILKNASYRTCRSLLYEEVPPYAARLRDFDAQQAGEIVTDDAAVYESLNDYLLREQPENAGRLRLYNDPLLPLIKLYPIEKDLHDALQKRVWLASGAYLVIEQTEAMTVIDVNTGKFTGKKTMRDTVRMINLEAAKEAARQLRLRNLSGIILIDFINMESAEDQSELMRALSEHCFRDPVKTTVVDMTRLGLVEITRKKTRKPLYEQLQ